MSSFSVVYGVIFVQVLDREPGNIDAKKQIQEVDKKMAMQKSSNAPKLSPQYKLKAKTRESKTQKHGKLQNATTSNDQLQELKTKISDNQLLETTNNVEPITSPEDLDPDILQPIDKPVHLRSKVSEDFKMVYIFNE